MSVMTKSKGIIRSDATEIPEEKERTHVDSFSKESFDHKEKARLEFNAQVKLKDAIQAMTGCVHDEMPQAAVIAIIDKSSGNVGHFTITDEDFMKSLKKLINEHFGEE